MIRKEPSYVLSVLIGIAVVIIGFIVVAFIMFSFNGDESDSCKETSTTTAEYRVCIAFAQCRSDFEGNSQLTGSCIADIIIQSVR